jgi:hypothetical protein
MQEPPISKTAGDTKADDMPSQWYIAELVMEITVVNDPRNVVHRNLMLLKAGSADEAYDKALRLGKEGETSYLNPAGKLVRIAFIGVADLDLVQEDLEDGAELTFYYRVGVPSDEVKSLIPPRDGLRAFRPPKRAEGPDYASAEVIAEVKRQFGIDRPASD